MRKWILLICSASLLTAADASRDVMAALDAYKQAMIKRDATALGKVLSEDLVYTHSSNLHQDKAALIESLKGPTATEAIDFKDPKIHVYGNTATVKGDVDVRNAINGNSTVIHLNILHVLVKGKQGWQLVARQATRYPDTASKK
jgi:ketosteroid isomerase-like protein